MHFSQTHVFLNTDFGRGGRDFGRETLLRTKNRTELLTPPAVLRFFMFMVCFLHLSFFFGKETCTELWREKNIRRYFSFRHEEGTVNSFTGRLTLTKANLLSWMLLQKKACSMDCSYNKTAKQECKKENRLGYKISRLGDYCPSFFPLLDN